MTEKSIEFEINLIGGYDVGVQQCLIVKLYENSLYGEDAWTMDYYRAMSEEGIGLSLEYVRVKT